MTTRRKHKPGVWTWQWGRVGCCAPLYWWRSFSSSAPCWLETDAATVPGGKQWANSDEVRCSVVVSQLLKSFNTHCCLCYDGVRCGRGTQTIYYISKYQMKYHSSTSSTRNRRSTWNLHQSCSNYLTTFSSFSSYLFYFSLYHFIFVWNWF